MQPESDVLGGECLPVLPEHVTCRATQIEESIRTLRTAVRMNPNGQVRRKTQAPTAFSLCAAPAPHMLPPPVWAHAPSASKPFVTQIASQVLLAQLEHYTCSVLRSYEAGYGRTRRLLKRALELGEGEGGLGAIVWTPSQIVQLDVDEVDALRVCRIHTKHGAMPCPPSPNTHHTRSAAGTFQRPPLRGRPVP